MGDNDASSRESDRAMNIEANARGGESEILNVPVAKLAAKFSSKEGIYSALTESRK
jgi:hypothetical protein